MHGGIEGRKKTKLPFFSFLKAALALFDLFAMRFPPRAVDESDTMPAVCRKSAPCTHVFCSPSSNVVASLSLSLSHSLTFSATSSSLPLSLPLQQQQQQTTTTTTKTKGRLPLSTKLAYGAPALATTSLSFLVSVYLTDFYVALGAPLAFLNFFTAAARSLDVLTDPVMGWASDRTRGRFGRRLPYTLSGCLVYGALFAALFSPPAAVLSSAKAAPTSSSDPSSPSISSPGGGGSS